MTDPVVAPPATPAVAAVPVVTGLFPIIGPAGTAVTISGTGFTGATSVKFGTVEAKFTVNDDTAISAVSPVGAGSSGVTVTTPGGASAVVAAGIFTMVPPPKVTSIAPTEGPTAGGTVVAITGTGFTGATGVKFGASPAASFAVNTDTSITATSSPGADVVDVIVVTPAGSTGAGTKFKYVGTPVVVAKCTTAPPVGNDGTVIPKIGTVLTIDPSGYGTDLHGYLSVTLPPGAAINDAVEMYAISARERHGVLISVFPPVGESINSHPISTGKNADAASSVASNSGRMFRKVSATNWQSLGGGND